MIQIAKIQKFFYVSVMQESPQLGVRWSIIALNGLSYEDAGEYLCQARNMAGISEAQIKLKVVGVTSLSRLLKRKSHKTASRPLSNTRKPYEINPRLSKGQSSTLKHRTNIF